jgi:sugar phosphate isomerase/epimerase
MRVTRREFIESAAAAAAVAATAGVGAQTPGRTKNSTYRGVVIGANSFCFPDRPIEQAVDVIADLGFTTAEVHPRHMEPSFGPVQRGVPMSAENREKLRQWRLTVPMSHYEAVGERFRKAGISVFAYNVNYRPDFTDGELERSLEATRALGARVVSGAGITAALARRLDPMAKRHDVRIGVHNHAGEIRGEADFDAILEGLSDRMAINLDIGHYVAANADPVALLKRRHDDILLLHVKDRKRNEGPDQPFGKGDTPILETLRLLRDQQWKIPANIEWEVNGDRVAAVRECLEYCRQALES